MVHFRLNIQHYFPKTNGSLKIYEREYANSLLMKLAQQEQILYCNAYMFCL